MTNLAHSTQHEPYAVMTTVTPEIAGQWLEKNEYNRKLKPGLINRYAATMREGRWRVNGETIILTESGELLNGQHRLYGCILAKTSFQTFVVFGIDKSAFPTMDAGKKRTAGDILSIEGCKNGNSVASAYKWLVVIERQLPSVSNVILDGDEIRLAWIADPAPEESVVKAGVARKIIIQGAAGALHYNFAKLDAEAADQFFVDLASGAGLTAHDPVLALREWLLSTKTRAYKHPVSDGEKVARCIRAWNHRRSGHKTKQLKGMYRSSEGTYSLPEIE